MTQVESPEDVAVAVHLALAAAGLSDMVWGHASVPVGFSDCLAWASTLTSLIDEVAW